MAAAQGAGLLAKVTAWLGGRVFAADAVEGLPCLWCHAFAFGRRARFPELVHTLAAVARSARSRAGPWNQAFLADVDRWLDRMLLQDRGDDALLDAVRAGNAAAFTLLYERERAWILRMARRCAASEADASDVLQETLLYLLRKLPDLELRCRLRTFLFPVVRHIALSHRRRSSRHAPLDVDHEPMLDVSQAADLDEVGGLITTVLPEGDAAIVWRHFVAGFPLPQVALLLRMPLGTVKWRLYRALRRLREDSRVRAHFLDDPGGKPRKEQIHQPEGLAQNFMHQRPRAFGPSGRPRC